MSELDQSQEKITSDAATAEYGVRAAELFEGAAQDNLGRLVVSTMQEPRPVMNVSAVASPGRAADVTAFGMEMHQAVTSATGAPAAFVVSVSGAFDGTRFALRADSMAELQAANEKLQGDGTVAKLMEKARDLFVPGSGQSVILRRIN